VRREEEKKGKELSRTFTQRRRDENASHKVLASDEAV
jgi:hypothetical protein